MIPLNEDEYLMNGNLNASRITRTRPRRKVSFDLEHGGERIRYNLQRRRSSVLQVVHKGRGALHDYIQNQKVSVCVTTRHLCLLGFYLGLLCCVHRTQVPASNDHYYFTRKRKNANRQYWYVLIILVSLCTSCTLGNAFASAFSGGVVCGRSRAQLHPCSVDRVTLTFFVSRHARCTYFFYYLPPWRGGGL